MNVERVLKFNVGEIIGMIVIILIYNELLLIVDIYVLDFGVFYGIVYKDIDDFMVRYLYIVFLVLLCLGFGLLLCLKLSIIKNYFFYIYYFLGFRKLVVVLCVVFEVKMFFNIDIV